VLIIEKDFSDASKAGEIVQETEKKFGRKTENDILNCYFRQ